MERRISASAAGVFGLDRLRRTNPLLNLGVDVKEGRVPTKSKLPLNPIQTAFSNGTKVGLRNMNLTSFLGFLSQLHTLAVSIT